MHKQIGVGLVLAVVSTGCITVVRESCEGGFCGVAFNREVETRLAPRPPAEVALNPTGEALPPGAVRVGTFRWPVGGFDIHRGGGICSVEIDGFFRQKAANLGFDGVAGMALANPGESGGGAVVVQTGPGGSSLNGQSVGPAVGGTGPTSMSMGAFGGGPAAICVGIPYILQR